jgi:hypothetical protein
VPGDVVFTLSRSAVPILAALFVAAFSAAFLPRFDLSVGLAILLSGALVLNLREFAYFAEVRGPAFAIAVIPLHFFSQILSGIGLCTGWILRDTFGDGAPDAATQAYAEVGVQSWPPVPRAPGDIAAGLNAD